MVPILELPDGKILTDSKILMDYVEDAYPHQGYSLFPDDPVMRAKMRTAIPLLDAYNAAWWPIYMKKLYN